MYLHNQELIHGDLKGVRFRPLVSTLLPNLLFMKANVLVDKTFRARLADFGDLNFAVDPTDPTNSPSIEGFGGSLRWMSPELLDIEGSRPTKESDCYALGMVILEVLSGQLPFAGHRDVVAIQRVVSGEHPERPKGVWSTNIWETLEQCWSLPPERRPTAEVILDRLGRVTHEPTVWVGDPNNAATMDGSGVSSCGTAMSHRESFAGIPNRVC